MRLTKIFNEVKPKHFIVKPSNPYQLSQPLFVIFSCNLNKLGKFVRILVCNYPKQPPPIGVLNLASCSN